MSEVVVTFEHLGKLKYCSPRIKEWCQQHQIDFRRFRSTVGVPVSELRATGCALAIKAADLAEQEAAQ